MNCSIKNKVLVIELPLNPSPIASRTGKTLVVASTYGNKQTDAKVDGKFVTVGVNAYIRPEG